MSTVGVGATRSRSSGMMRLWEVADTVLFVAVLNVMVVVMSVAGAVVFGIAPALAAATACARARLRGETHPWIRMFLGQWREQFVHANLLQAPAGLILILLGVNYLMFSTAPGTPFALLVAFAVAAAITVVYQGVVVAMDAHYDLRRRDCLRFARLFMLRFPGAPLLLAATFTLIVVATYLLPGLLAVFTIGTGIYLGTALCLSFFAANDRNVTSRANDGALRKEVHA